MADSLYLSLWFREFETDDMLPQALAVLKQFPYSSQAPGISEVAVHPVNWIEPTILEQRFKPGIRPEEAVLIAADLLHEDYAYAFEAFWDLWKFDHTINKWLLQPAPVQFLVHGSEFDEGASEQEGNIQVDFGLDSPFLQETLQLTTETEQRVRANVQKLVDFTNAVEKNAGITTRLLWSESDENFAQKLISRLQKVH